jgi:hypothetical protein
MPPDTAIFGPVFALAAWTLAVLLRVAFVRLSAAWRREVQPGDFRLGESPSVPASISLPNRNYMNLLELPVLFYVVCVIAYVTATANTLVVDLAWLYVLLRVVHSLIHLAYNNVVHRLAAFAASNFVLVGIWVLVGLALRAKAAA